jgi:dihydrofolate reductase
MKLSVFIGVSLDGFIACRNGDYDFLPTDGGEPHGYDEFIATVDTILLGRNTFDVVLKLPSWPYGDKRVVVLSNRPLDFSGIRFLSALHAAESHVAIYELAKDKVGSPAAGQRVSACVG